MSDMETLETFAGKVATILIDTQDAPSAIKKLMEYRGTAKPKEDQSYRWHNVLKAARKHALLKMPRNEAFLEAMESAFCLCRSAEETRLLAEYLNKSPIEQHELSKRSARDVIPGNAELSNTIRTVLPLPEWYYAFQLPAAIQKAIKIRKAKQQKHNKANAKHIDNAPHILAVAQQCVQEHPDTMVRCNDLGDVETMAYELLASLQLVTGRRPGEILGENALLRLDPVPGFEFQAITIDISKGSHDGRIPLLTRCTSVNKAMEVLRRLNTSRALLLEGDTLVKPKKADKKRNKILKFCGQELDYRELRGLFGTIAFETRHQSGFMPDACSNASRTLFLAEARRQTGPTSEIYDTVTINPGDVFSLK